MAELDLFKYLKERFLNKDWLLLSLLFGFIATPIATIDSGSIKHFIVLTIVATFCLFEFRLLDDLCSRKKDFSLHPKRTLCKTDNIFSFWLVCLGSFIFLSILFYTLVDARILFLYFILMLTLILMGFELIPRTLFLELAKYPISIYLLGEVYNINYLEIWFSAVLVYLVFVVNELKGKIWPFYLLGVIIVLMKVAIGII